MFSSIKVRRDYEIVIDVAASCEQLGILLDEAGNCESEKEILRLAG